MSERYPHTAADLRLPARYYARVAEMWLRKGVDLPALARTAGVNLAELMQADATLSLAQVDALVQHGMNLTGHHDLALDLGRELKLSSHSIVGFGILSSPTLEYALRLAARFFSLIMPSFRMRCLRSAHGFELWFKPCAAMSRQCLNLHLEAIAVAVHFEVNELLRGDLPDYSIMLSMDTPQHVQRYREIPQAHVQFGALPRPGLRIIFPIAIATRSLAMADSAALSMAESRCNELVRHVISRGRVAEWTRMVLRESSQETPSLTELAHTLNMSARTLDRHLQREGASYRDLLKAVRLDKACVLLANGNLSITEIALELGYSDAANFTRAFRQSCGCSPSVYRARAAV